MKFVLSCLLLASTTLTISCVNEYSKMNVPSLKDNIQSQNIEQKNLKNETSLSTEMAKKLVESLDLNKDGIIDATETPIMVQTNDSSVNINERFIMNTTFNSTFTDYINKPLKVEDIITFFLKDSSSEIYISNAGISEKNAEKIVSNLANILIKDTIAQNDKVYAFSSKHTTQTPVYLVKNLSLPNLIQEISEQFKFENEIIDGIPKKLSVGVIVISRDYITIDKYKTRLSFGNYNTFKNSSRLISSYELKNPKITK